MPRGGVREGEREECSSPLSRAMLGTKLRLEDIWECRGADGTAGCSSTGVTDADLLRNALGRKDKAPCGTGESYHIL